MIRKKIDFAFISPVFCILAMLMVSFQFKHYHEKSF